MEEQPPATFDLSAESSAKGRNYSAFRKATLVMAGLMSLLLIWTLSIALAPGRLTTSTEWVEFFVLVPGIGGMTLLMLYASWKFGAGATSVSLDSVGLEFTWSSGKHERLAWGELARGVVLLDYSVTPSIPELTGVSWELRRRTRPASYLTHDAFHAIVIGAQNHGMEVRSIIPARTDFRRNFWGWARGRVITFSQRS